ncbi:ribosome biogenesis protein ytm1 [Coemansia guatemalensis]|uniref:Ribosome biogenesis protein ytm1 n=1 Tax=Coemansia guatemalensis TaxID=2761395 RepID=A0A9W8HTE5_9FUNG|nr:ribosome biogenesis protein ytm1 [Coemansia guatemalensis]
MLGDEETGIRAQLDTALEKLAQTQAQKRSNGEILDSLRQLSKISNSLEEMDRRIQTGNIEEAAQAVVALESVLESDYMLEDTRIKTVLRNRMAEARVNMRESTLDELRGFLVAESDADSAQIRVGAAGAQAVRQRAQSLLTAMDTLAVADEVRQALCTYVINTAIRPMLKARQVSRKEAADGSAAFEVRLSDAEEPSGSAEVCSVVLGAAEFVSGALGGNVKAELWTAEALAELAKLVLERCFLRCIPATRAELVEFRSEAEQMERFEKQLLGHSGPIFAATERLDELFIEQQSARALAQVRTLAEDVAFESRDLPAHEEWTVELLRALAETSGELAPLLAQAALAVEATKRVFPKCAVSASAHGLVATAYGLVNEAAQSGTAAQQLVRAARCLFDLHRALSVTLHHAQLRSTPALAWLFHNDCLYSAHHAAALGALSRHLLPADEAGIEGEAWQRTASQLVAAASALTEELLRTESAELQRISGDRRGFGSAAADGQRAVLAKTASRARLAVTQLCRAMRPPAVTPHVFYRALGRYIDAVFSATIGAVTDVPDISADDSQVLSEHCRNIHSLTALFRLDAELIEPYCTLQASSLVATGALPDQLLDSDAESESSGPELPSTDADPACRTKDSGSARLAHRYCLLSDKLIQLADILVISRADILARRRAGLLVQFTTDEVISLVRALFSDTPERARDIDELRRLG